MKRIPIASEYVSSDCLRLQADEYGVYLNVNGVLFELTEWELEHLYETAEEILDAG